MIRRKHAVMMEYVIIAVMIAAAVVGAIVVFGRTVTDQMGVATKAMVSPTEAKQSHETSKKDLNTNVESGKTHANTFHSH